MNCKILTKWGRIALFFFVLTSFVEARNYSVVVLDPGHGGRDKGAFWGGVRESTLNLKVARRVATELRSRGVKVVMTRNSDRYVSYRQRAAVANRYRNAIFVSIHFNASRATSATGVETFCVSREGYKMASQVQKRLHTRLKRKNRGVKRRNFAVLSYTNCPAILVECGFISNYYERQKCVTSWYQGVSAKAIADGLMRYKRL